MEQYDTLATVAPALFGRVDRCRHRASGELVAVKRMELGLAGRRRAKDSQSPVHEDIFAELQANLKVQTLGGHPFVLPMRDAFIDDDAVHLVLAYCARGELLGVVNAQRHTLSMRHKLRYFKQVLLAVAFLHAHGIAHRDLSLENVLVDAHDCCQVCDFGLTTSAAVLPPSPVGKVHYMAPEACAVSTNNSSPTAHFDPIKADVWSLGVMLFAMVAGRYPFREPLRRDDHFRLLEDFGMAYVLAKLDVDTTDEPAVADLLAQIFVLDPTVRPSAEALLQHSALAGVDCDPEALDSQNEWEEETPVSGSALALSAAELQALSTPLRHEMLSSSALAASSRRASWCPLTPAAIGSPVVRTVVPAAAPHTAASKELEVSPAEPAKPAPCLELVNRTLSKMFRKQRSDA